jgi:hypothetical protein
MTTAVKIAIQPIPDLHSHFRGSAEQVITKLAKSNSTNTRHEYLEPKLEKIPTDKLVPLESQRVTKDTWAQKRLQALGGLDMWAFGTLSVCRDPRDNVNYVWDGCGRLALAQLHGLKEVPCVVIEGEKEDAAFYFGYNQDSTQGRRTLSKEVLFINRYYSGEPSAFAESCILDRLGMYIKGDTNYAVPNPTPAGHVEIGYRAFHEAITISGKDETIQRQARDMIVTAWSNNPNGCIFISQDIYWAVVQLLTSIPTFRKNGLNISLQKFLINIATGQNQDRVDWKVKGLSGNAGVSKQLALGLLEAFKKSTFWKPAFANSVTYKQIMD